VFAASKKSLVPFVSHASFNHLDSGDLGTKMTSQCKTDQVRGLQTKNLYLYHISLLSAAGVSGKPCLMP
jgi:hypothetical protein